MVSFPAGIVQVLANNPSPAPLVFRVRNASKMEGVVPNKQLVTLWVTLLRIVDVIDDAFVVSINFHLVKF